MMTAELVHEYLAAMRPMKLDQVRQLTGHGLPMRSISIACPAPLRVRRFGGRFVPDGAGAFAWIMPIGVSDPQCPWDIEVTDPTAIVSTGPVVDLVAFSPSAPGQWALRLGKAAALGAIPPQYLDPDPVRLFRDVTDWLRGGCTGLVLLTRNEAILYQLLTTCRAGVVAEDDEHAAALRAILGWPGRITVARDVLEVRDAA